MTHTHYKFADSKFLKYASGTAFHNDFRKNVMPFAESMDNYVIDGQYIPQNYLEQLDCLFPQKVFQYAMISRLKEKTCRGNPVVYIDADIVFDTFAIGMEMTQFTGVWTTKTIHVHCKKDMFDHLSLIAEHKKNYHITREGQKICQSWMKWSAS